nr:class I SAM-dependent methyltransferase [Kineosporia rhizophila]
MATGAELTGYLRAVSLREDEVLRDLRQTTAELPWGEAMQVPPEEGQLLGLLAGLTPARMLLEIGTFTGYSTLCLARALSPGGRVVTCDITDRWAPIARPAWQRAGVADRIEERFGDAAVSLQEVENDYGRGGFDLIFIDADKSGYPAYYEAALRLVSKAGLIVVDNTLFFGRVFDPGHDDPDTVAVRGFNQALLDDERVDISLLPMADGITLIRRRR